MSEVEHVPATPATVDPVYELRVAIGDMLERVQGLARDGDWETLVAGLEPLQQVLSDLRILEQEVKHNVALLMPEREVTVGGVRVERKPKITRRNWQSDKLLRALVLRALVDPDTGEIPSSPVEAVDRVLGEVKACVPFTGSTGWRVTALRERGYEPDEWCDENMDGWSLVVHRDKTNG